MSSPDSVVDICSGKLLTVATLSMKAGSHLSIGPQVPSGIVMVACSVAGLRSVGVLGVWPLRARTAAISEAVTCTCAKVGFTLADGLYRSLIPAVVGFCFHAVVR